MSFEIKNCSTENILVYNDTIPCRGYDDVIYNQLPENQKFLIKACGYARLEPKDAFSNMLLDVHYLDQYSKKKKGEPFQETTTNYTDRFLKSAEIVNPNDKAMTIPFNPVPRRSSLRTRLDFSMTTTPNNTASHSIFLYIPSKKRKYEELLFLCKPPGIPPPTPPELLALQMEALEKLQMNQKQLLQVIQDVVSNLKDALKRHLLLKAVGGKTEIQKAMKEIFATIKTSLEEPREEAVVVRDSSTFARIASSVDAFIAGLSPAREESKEEEEKEGEEEEAKEEEEKEEEEEEAPFEKKPYKTILEEINLYKAEKQDDEKRVALYKKFSQEIFSTLQAIDKEKIEMEDEKATLEKYKKIIEDAKVPEKLVITANNAMSIMTSMATPGKITEGLKQVLNLFWKDLQQKYYNTVSYIKQKLPGYPTKEQLQKLESSIPAHQLQIEKLQESLEPSKETIQQSRDLLPAWYTQNTIELYVDSKLELTPREVSKESIREISLKEKKYSQNCEELKKQETESEEGTYMHVAQMIQFMKFMLLTNLNKIYMEEKEDENTIFTKKVLLQFMIQMPEPKANSFDEYKMVWEYDKCAPSPYYLPHKGDSKTTSILLPNFESFVSMVLRYRDIKPLSTILSIA
jgi:hypothetical protein